MYIFPLLLVQGFAVWVSLEEPFGHLKKKLNELIIVSEKWNIWLQFGMTSDQTSCNYQNINKQT